MKRLCFQLAVAVMALPFLHGAALAQDGYQAGPSTAFQPKAYRMLTYNVQLRPGVVGDRSEYNLDNETRAQHLATRILQGGYDIVALQEVFHEGARDILADRLGAAYPTVVDRLDGPWPWEDSGLMLFSKFPLVEVTTPGGGECAVEGAAGKCRVPFHVYTDGMGWDAYANKGIAMVRLSNPATGRPVNTFFTHLQATEDSTDDSYRQKRQVQLAEAKSFINAWAPLSTRDTQDAVLMGDLNIVGPPNANTTEYWADLVSAGGLGGLGFTESYDFNALGGDPMRTFDGPRNIAAGNTAQRLDYAFLRPATGKPICVGHQRVRRDYTVELGSGEGYAHTDLSDHYGVDLTLGPVTPNCGPQHARPIASDGEYPQRIDVPGTAQWFRINEPGTYSFDFNSAGKQMNVNAYRVSDLSEELPAYEGSPSLVHIQGAPFSNRVVFSVDEAFYVKVSGIVGDYVLRTHRHQGASFDDAIALDPFTSLHQTQLAGGASRVHYSLIQRALDNGRGQQLEFTTSAHPDVALRLQVFNDDRQLVQVGVPVCQPGGGPVAGPVCTGVRPLRTGYQAGSQRLATDDLSGGRQKLYLTVDREDCAWPSPCRGAYDVEWTTDYRELDLTEVIVRPTNYDAGSLAVKLRIDGGPESVVDMGRFGTSPMGKGTRNALRGIGFTRSVTLQVVSTTSGLMTVPVVICVPATPSEVCALKVLGEDPIDTTLTATLGAAIPLHLPVAVGTRVHN